MLAQSHQICFHHWTGCPGLNGLPGTWGSKDIQGFPGMPSKVPRNNFSRGSLGALLEEDISMFILGDTVFSIIIKTNLKMSLKGVRYDLFNNCANEHLLGTSTFWTSNF